MKIIPEMNFLKSDAFKISILYFVVTRLALIVIGYCVFHEFALHGIAKSADLTFSDNSFFTAFGTYDTRWYLRIVENWYPNFHNAPPDCYFEEYSFFPLYPALIRLVSFITRADYFFSGLIISNICLIFSGYFLHKISEKYYNKSIANWSVIFMYSFPVAFIYSGVFTESLYLMLILIALYYASLEKWFAAGVGAMFLTLCRPVGVFVILPLAFMYFKNINFNFRKINKNILGLMLIFAGLLILAVHHFIVSGGEFSVFALFGSGYKLPFGNPIRIFWVWLTTDYFSMPFLAVFTFVFMAFWIIFYKHISIPFHIIVLYSLLIPMCYTIMSMPRMMLVAFPLFIMLASVALKYKIQLAVLIFCVLFQGYLFVCWCLGWGNVI